MDALKELALMYNGIKSVVLDYAGDEGLVGNYVNQLGNAIKDNDIESIKYCLNEISSWYSDNISIIHSNEYVYNNNEHKATKSQIEKFVKAFKNYQLSSTENYYDRVCGVRTDMTEAEFIQSYIYKIDNTVCTDNDDTIIELCLEITRIFSDIIPGIKDEIFFQNETAKQDASVLRGRLTLELIKRNHKESNNSQNVSSKPIIFLSHQSSDKQYGDALEELIMGFGVKKDQLIYTSHPLHRVPIGNNIYDYLREHIRDDILMIVLWSDNYLNSPACLNEMGAAWVTKPEVVQIYTPRFDFSDSRVGKCAISTRESGIMLTDDKQCKAGLLEFKKKIEEKLSILIDETTASYYIDKFVERIKEINNG